MGTLMGRAASVVVYSLQSAMAACSCSGKMSNRPEAVGEKMSSLVADNAGLQKAIIIPDINIEHVSSRSCDNGSAPLLHGNEISFTSNLTPASTGMLQITKNHKNIRLDLNGANDTAIELPQRFRNSFLSEKKDRSVLDKMDISSCILGKSSCSNSTSTEDISQAISWIHQELESMKEQDKVLLRQFLDLRAAIRSLRAEGGRLRTLSYGGRDRDDKTETLRQQSNGSDVNDDVTADDDDVFASDGTPCNNSSLHEGCKIEFRSRTVSCISPRVKYNVPTRHLTKS